MDPITIELLNPTGLAFVGEPFPLQLVIRCPEGGGSTVLRSIRSRDEKLAALDADLFGRDTPMQPGEVYRCIVIARFTATGEFPDPMFVVVAGRDALARAVRVPTPHVRVVPSLLNELRVSAEPICTYDGGTKIDVTLAHKGATRFDNFRLTVGPTDAVRAGVSDQRRPAFAHGEELKFTTVVATSTLVLELDATAGGQRVGPVPLRLAVPPVRDAEGVSLFRFLEPKKLTQAEVRIHAIDEDRNNVIPANGLFTVSGGGDKYIVEIEPAHPHAQGVKLRGVSGVVEAAEVPSDAGVWAFQLVVVSNGVLTSTTTLHFDVVTPEGVQQGELNLSIRPQNVKLWLVAATAGAAVTVKGFAALVPALLRPGDLFDNIGSVVSNSRTALDMLQLLSIFLIRSGLWVLDRVVRPFQDD